MLKLRPYQQQIIDAVKADWQKYTDVLVTAATGSGKTLVFLQLLIDMLTDNAKRALILSHRQELIHQPVERIEQHWPEWTWHTGIVMADNDDCSKRITVATVQTLSSEKRLRQLLAYGPIDYLITDETHHATADSYVKVYDMLKDVNPEMRHLGVTATPIRSDGAGLVQVFQKESAHFGIRELVKMGYLAPPRWLAIQTGISLKGVTSHNGDYSAKRLADVFDTSNCFDLVVESHRKYADGRQCLAFTASVAGAYNLAEKFNESGIVAAAADATTAKSERHEILRDFRNGKIQVLCNMGLFTEGLDVPQVSCIHQVRPTKSDALYTQCLDRETEILTPYGWKKEHEISVGDVIAGYSLDTGTIQWVNILRKILRPVAVGEKMVEYSSPSLEFRVTDGHRMIYELKNNVMGRRFITAGELAKRSDTCFLPIAGYQDAPGVPLTDDELRFIGWFVTDGTLSKVTGQILIGQAEHQPFHDDIKSCLEGCGFKYSIYRQSYDKSNNFNATSDQIRYAISKGKPRGVDKHLRGWGELEPYIDKNLSLALEDMTREQLMVFLEAVHMGDGAKQNGQSWTRRSYHIATGNDIFAERLQSLCVRRGYKCNVSCHIYNHNPIYILHIKDTDRRSIGGQRYTDRSVPNFSEPNANEIVWCVENKLGTLVTRRNGKVLIMGNCIGRGLRIVPGKEDCLILDYAPVESRNVVMMGDVLGVDARKDVYVKESEEPGEVVGGMTFDGDVKWLSGDPMEIISRQMDYLSLSPFSWHKAPDGWMSIGLGKASDDIERSLLMSPPGESMTLYLVAKRPGEGNRAYLVQEGDIESLSDWAEGYIEERGQAILAQKAKRWRREAATDAQIRFARRLGVEKFESKGQVAEEITHKLAMKALESVA